METVKVKRCRVEILSQEVLKISDIAELFGLSKEVARQKMLEIKHSSDRLRIAGHVHIQYYYEYYRVPIEERVAISQMNFEMMRTSV